MWWENIQFLALEPHGEEQIKIKKKKKQTKTEAQLLGRETRKEEE